MGATTTLVTVQEFLEMPEVEGVFQELIGGEIATMPRAGQPHEVAKSNLFRALVPWSLQYPGMRMFVEAAFQLDDRHCLIPDISLIRSNRIIPGSKSVFQTGPEIAIQVVSSEPAARLEQKIRLYLAHGGHSVWAVYPQERMVRTQDAEGNSRIFDGDRLLTDPTLPGFSIPTSAIFEGV
jgi:Uma2 family endonuclease